ncbi:MAG TPA: hypothetical protein VGR21_02130 [Cryptosporangiaceae bacterium]|nr:hypothetical protein [Cryptosporangiaceae bacterium]
MVVIGLLLVVLAVVFAVGLMLTPGGQTEIEFFGLVLPNLPARTLVLMGLAAGVVFVLGLRVMRWGLSAAARRRRERKEAAAAVTAANREAQQARIEQAETERAQADHTETDRAHSPHTEPPPPPAGTSSEAGRVNSPQAEAPPPPPAGNPPPSGFTPTSEERSVR